MRLGNFEVVICRLDRDKLLHRGGKGYRAIKRETILLLVCCPLGLSEQDRLIGFLLVHSEVIQCGRQIMVSTFLG